ncbi:putative membrane fusion protein [Brassicibacter mesophilus]
MVYLVFRIIPTLITGNSKTVTVEIGELEDVVAVKGIILKDETVYKSEAQGRISFNKNEGDKVGKGIKILEVTKNGNDSYLKQINEIDKQIASMTQSGDSKEVFKQDIDKNQANIENIIKEIQEGVIDEDYQRVNDLKDQLFQKMDKHQIITGQKTLAAENIESLKKKKQQLLDDKNKLKTVRYSDKAGILSYNIDGLEEIYGAKKLDEYKPDDFKTINVQQTNVSNNSEVNPGDSVFKIIDNYKWYIMAKVDNDIFSDLKEGKRLFLEIGEEEKKISANVVEVNSSKSDMIIIFKVDDYLYRFYNERYIDVKILRNTYEGLMIPNEAITEKDGLKGVYIKDISGIVKFRPIKVLGSNDEYTIVSEGENSRIEVEINGKKQKMYTLKMFDEIFVNGHKVKEGQIIN